MDSVLFQVPLPAACTVVVAIMLMITLFATITLFGVLALKAVRRIDHLEQLKMQMGKFNIEVVGRQDESRR